MYAYTMTWQQYLRGKFYPVANCVSIKKGCKQIWEDNPEMVLAWMKMYNIERSQRLEIQVIH